MASVCNAPNIAKAAQMEISAMNATKILPKEAKMASAGSVWLHGPGKVRYKTNSVSAHWT